MTALHKLPPAPPAKSTTHSQPRAGHDWSAGPWKHPPQPVNRPWLESNLAALIVTAAACALVWTLFDYVWTKAVTEPSILVD